MLACLAQSKGPTIEIGIRGFIVPKWRSTRICHDRRQWRLAWSADAG
jgi:hypothetical protein